MSDAATRWANVLRSSDSVSARVHAIESLAALGKDASQGVGALIEALESRYPAVRTAAHSALRELAKHGVRVVTALKLVIEASHVPLPATAYALEHIEAELRLAP